MKLDRLITLVLSFTILSSISIFAQSRVSVVLIDGKATEVMLKENGQIDYVIREVPSHIPNYKSSEQNHFVSKKNSTSKYLNRVEKVIYFLPGEAVMTEATIQKLNELSQLALSNSHRILLETNYSEAHAGTKTLSRNRLAACKAYLKIKGVPEGLITIAMTESRKPSARVNVFLK